MREEVELIETALRPLRELIEALAFRLLLKEDD
jgi:hypothetical protein